MLTLIPEGVLAQMAVTVTNNSGSVSVAGSLGEAVSEINGYSGGGNIVLAISPNAPITLNQPLPASESVTFLGTSTDSTLTMIGENESTATSNFSNNLRLDSGMTFNFENDGSGGVGQLDCMVTVGTNLSVEANTALTILAADGTTGSAAGSAVLGVNDSSILNNSNSMFLKGGTGGENTSGTGGAGGDASIQTVILNFSGSDSQVNLMGGNGGIGATTGIGGNASIVGAQLTFLGSSNEVTLSAGNGELGGSAGITLDLFSTSENSNNLSILSGSGIQNSGNATGSISAIFLTGNLNKILIQGAIGGNGGNAALTSNSAILSNSSNGILILGGNTNSNGIGGSAWVSIGTVELSGSSNLIDSMGGSGTTGGSVSMMLGKLTLENSQDDLNILGGTGTSQEGNAYVTVGTFQGDGVVTILGANPEFQISSGNFSGTINGNCNLIKVGNGILDLNGINTYSGGTTVSDGTLVIGTSGNIDSKITSNLTLAAAGEVQGVGTIAGSVVNNGLVVPGNGISGTLTTESYNQNTSGVLGINITPSQETELSVTNTAQLNGTLAATIIGNFGIRYNFTLLSAKSVTGEFTNLQIENPIGFSTSLIYDSNSVVLMMDRLNANFDQFAQTPNELSVAQVLNQQIPTASGNLLSEMNQIYVLNGQSTILSQLSGSIYTVVPEVEMENIQSQIDTLLQHLSNRLSQNLAGSNFQHQSGLDGYWVSNLDNFGTILGNANVSKYETFQYSLMAGYDWRFHENLLGTALGYQHAIMNSSDLSGGSANMEAWINDFYGSHTFGWFSLNGIVGYGFNHYQIVRSISIGNLINGNLDGYQLVTNWNILTQFKINQLNFEPILGVQYSYISTSPTEETGGQSFDLIVPSEHVNSLRPFLGILIKSSFKILATEFIPSIKITAYKEAIPQGNQELMAFAAAPNEMFGVYGINPPTLIASIEAGMNIIVTPSSQIQLSYEGILSATENLNGILGSFELKF